MLPATKKTKKKTERFAFLNVQVMADVYGKRVLSFPSNKNFILHLFMLPIQSIHFELKDKWSERHRNYVYYHWYKATILLWLW